jgi:[acyl-carrier-protein] S-malonyltransferase
MSIAWLFPGQGSQAVGMGGDVRTVSAAARAIFERVDEALGERLSRLILEGPEQELTLTMNSQPAILATSCALLAAIRERVPELGQPAFAAGHSLGEYSALVAAEALSLEDAVRLVRARGRAMQDAVPAGTGAMSAILGLEPARVEELCREAVRAPAGAEGEQVCSPANLNAPGQVVVAGHAAAVARVGELVAAAKGRAIPLKVSAPFHCKLMAPAARALEVELARIAVRPPRFPVVANVDARPNSDAGRVTDLLVRQVDQPVRWEESVRVMVEAGVTHALEIGPGKVLAGLVKRIAKDVKVLSVGDAASLDAVEGFLRASCTGPATRL